MYHFAQWVNPTIATVMMSKWDGQGGLNMAERCECVPFFFAYLLYYLFPLLSVLFSRANGRPWHTILPLLCAFDATFHLWMQYLQQQKNNEWIKVGGRGVSTSVSALTLQNDAQETQGNKRKGIKPSQTHSPSGPLSPFNTCGQLFFSSFSCHQKHEIKPLVPTASCVSHIPSSWTLGMLLLPCITRSCSSPTVWSQQQ